MCTQEKTWGLRVSAIALGVAVLLGVAGCTRTSDGSIVMNTPSLEMPEMPKLNLLSFGGDRQARVVRSKTIQPQSVVQPKPQPTSVRRTGAKASKVTVPPMSIARNPPFKGVQVDKPLSCRNETTSAGRIRVVCI